MDSTTKMQRITAVARAFTPGAPVDELDMLAGRINQLTDVVNVVSLKGQHVALYGERGVGKTSLANVLAEFFGTQLKENYQSVVVNCGTDDTFSSLWQNVFADLGMAEADSDEELLPESIRRRLEQLDPPALIVLDELDRFEDDQGLTMLADTLKTLSDHATSSTIVLVGVGRSVGELIGEHASIVRALVQIEMPRMSPVEIGDILNRGCMACGLTAQADAVEEIASLAEGLPHYAHLLGLHAGQIAVQNDRTEIRPQDVKSAIPKAVDRHTIQSDYQLATRSAQKALFAEVLLACALAPKNELGFFTSAAVRDPLEVIAGRRIDIPAFSNHLSQFLEPERGAVLHREGTSRRYFYRFRDPILQPFIVLTGLATGLLTEEQWRDLQPSEPLSDGDLNPDDFQPSGSQQLF